MSKIRLSRDGQKVRDKMLEQLKSEVVTSATRRRRQRQTLAVVPLVVLLVGIWTLCNIYFLKPPTNFVREGDSPNRVEPLNLFSIENVVVSNRDGVAQRYVVQSSEVVKREIPTVTDDEMIELLAQAGKPSALGRIDGRLTIIPLARTNASPITN